MPQKSSLDRRYRQAANKEGTLELSTILIWVPALVALIVIISASVFAKARLGSPIGGLAWSFSGSWASNLTALMVLFTTLFAIDELPADPYVSADDYTALSVMFAAMVIVAPILFLLAASYEPGGVQGRVWGFLIAGVLILWAVIGQLGTTFVLSLDLARSNLHAGAAAVLIGLSGLALVSAAVHGIRSTAYALTSTEAAVQEALAPPVVLMP